MSAYDNLSPHQFPEVSELALNHPAWTGEPEPLRFTEETVDPHAVRFQRYPVSDARVQSALKGYTSGDPVPPVTLVRRAGETMTADGHHRLSAAEHLGQPVQALIAHSPRKDEYRGLIRIGEVR